MCSMAETVGVPFDMSILTATLSFSPALTGAKPITVPALSTAWITTQPSWTATILSIQTLPPVATWSLTATDGSAAAANVPADRTNNMANALTNTTIFFASNTIDTPYTERGKTNLTSTANAPGIVWQRCGLVNKENSR